MIEFHEDGEVTVTSDTHRTLKFPVKKLLPGDTMEEHLDYIMNSYWKRVGKNRREYYDEV